jgi:hypothetical protein
VTQDEIIELAKQAKFSLANNVTKGYANKLEAFAKLVAEKEREACAKVCEDYGRAEEMQAIGNDYAQAIRYRGQA